MPIYNYACECGAKRDVLKPLRDYQSIEFCRTCGGPMTRQVTAPLVVGDYAGYDCPITGKWVEGRKAHRENLARHGCRVYEPGETQEFKRRASDEERQFDKAVEETVEATIHNMPARKRELLSAELQGGVTAEVTRDTPIRP